MKSGSVRDNEAIYLSGIAVPLSIEVISTKKYLFSSNSAQCVNVKSILLYREVFSLLACGLRRGCT